MNKAHILLLMAAGSLAPLAADTLSEAANAVRNGQPARALNLLEQAGDTVEQSFWRGRALLELERYKEAVDALSEVPTDHELYPYAAKAMIYCAQRSEELEPRVVLLPMTRQRVYPEIARMACAALAEHNLLHHHHSDADKELCTAEAARMMQAAWPDPAERTDPSFVILRGYLLAHQGRFLEAEELCRSAEANPSISTEMKLRARLALAEVYYQEADAAQEEEEREEAADKAEETLLQFISANPNSPLIDEAFRRLHIRAAFRKSEYAASKLREWAEDLQSAHRSCLAMYMLMVNPAKGNDSVTRSLTLANAALSHFPNEQAVRNMQLHHASRLVTDGAQQEAQVYLQQVPADDPYRLFYEAQIHRDDLGAAMHSYLDAARTAPEGLYTPALVNALTCAMRSGNRQEEEAIMQNRHLEPRTKAALLLARATHYADTRPDLARQDLEEALSLPVRAMLKAQCMLDLAALELEESPSLAARRLDELENELKPHGILPTESTRHGTFPHGYLVGDSWTAEQLLRYLSIKESCLRQLYGGNPRLAVQMVLEATHKIQKLTHDPSITSALTLFEASLMAEMQQNHEAIGILTALLQHEKNQYFRARAYLMMGRIYSSMETMDSLRKAIGYYEQSAKTDTWYADLATAFQASILVRFGELDKARILLRNLLQNKGYRMRVDVKAYVYSVLADSWALSSRINAPDEAIRACATMLANSDLPTEWRNRLLLQHATLCARYDRHQEALASYLALLDADPVASDHPSRGDWYLLYYAGAGAISSYLEAKEYSKAADIAERVGMWKTTFPEEFKIPSTRFLEWAKLIRRLHSTEREASEPAEKTIESYTHDNTARLPNPTESALSRHRELTPAQPKVDGGHWLSQPQPHRRYRRARPNRRAC